MIVELCPYRGQVLINIPSILLTPECVPLTILLTVCSCVMLRGARSETPVAARVSSAQLAPSLTRKRFDEHALCGSWSLSTPLTQISATPRLRITLVFIAYHI